MNGAAAVSPGAWRLAGGRRLALEAPVVAGILNLTPDSFSDGGELPTLDAALERARALVRAGAAMLDVGGESTRPGAREVPDADEIRRVVPFVREAGRELDVPIAVDTRKARVAAAALEAGAVAVNDVSGLAYDPDMGRVVADAGAGLVLMHMRGTPADMRERARYRDVVREVVAELGEAVERARSAGVADEALVVDPGLGFAKDAAQSLELLARLDELAELALPVYIGPSRKSFLGHVLGVPPRERGAGTVAACLLAWQKGARVFRVHEPEPVVRALAVLRAVAAAGTHVEDGPWAD